MLECFPQAVRFRADTAGSLTSERIEPIAADVRKGKDSIEDAKLKIIAGLIGVGFDELKQREAQRRRKGRWLGAAVSIAFTIALLLPDPGPLPQLRFSAFDAYQTHFPRARTSMPAVIIAIDEASLARVGQWPWPRDIMAKLITRIAEREPAAIGVDMLFPEPDRVSPENLAKIFRARDPLVADRLAKMRSNDAIFAEAIKNARVVIGVGGLEEPVIGHFPYTPSRQTGPTAPLRHYKGELRSLPEIDRAAAGHGLLSTGLDREVLRRVPLAAMLGDHPILSLPMECLRVASGTSYFDLHSDARGLRYVVIDLLAVPTQPDGSLWVNLAPRHSGLYISAADVLEGGAPEWINRKIALIGVTGLGLVDFVTTSGGERMPGIEIHAQVIENIFDNSLLLRPAIAVPRIPPRHSIGILLGCWLVVAALGIGAYLLVQVLFDPATLIAGITALYSIMVSVRLVTLFD
jgi:adenylate cyclase